MIRSAFTITLNFSLHNIHLRLANRLQSLRYCPPLGQLWGILELEPKMNLKLHIRSLVSATLLVLIATPAFALIDVDFLGYGDLGYVADGASLEYQHVFEPATHEDSDIWIEGVLLEVWIVDDWACYSMNSCMDDWFHESEKALLDLNNVEWASGQATAAIFWGDITAEANLLANDGVLNVTVSSGGGDFGVIKSALWTKYSYEHSGGGTGSTPMPEPSAALVFAIGVLALRGTLRRS